MRLTDNRDRQRDQFELAKRELWALEETIPYGHMYDSIDSPEFEEQVRNILKQKKKRHEKLLT